MTQPPRQRRQPRPVTPERLQKAALAYLERYASSAENLRRVLMRRVAASARLHGTDAREATDWVEDLVARYLAAGLLDDRAFAEARVRTLRGRGESARLIRARLAQKGVAEDDVAAALAAVDGDLDQGSDPEWAAALALARRRRLGPFRAAGDRDAHRERDLAALARAGFSYDTARRVVESDGAGFE
ncbi:MAG: RecX family transcriptional regulator [Hyphomicrobiales bacterium]|nr:RecX family transcriptional regulator [Hyphomicrobiales bacterium]MCP5373342.1 RecX family transcriptional regulator [Hyphomicrobiales bacterium]